MFENSDVLAELSEEGVISSSLRVGVDDDTRDAVTRAVISFNEQHRRVTGARRSAPVRSDVASLDDMVRQLDTLIGHSRAFVNPDAADILRETREKVMILRTIAKSVLMN